MQPFRARTPAASGSPRTRGGDLMRANTIEIDDLATKKVGSPPQPPIRGHIITLGELLKLQIPPREQLVEPFLTLSSLNMVFATRGIGKTWFTMELVRSLTQGLDFFAWKVPRKARVLHINGEMPTSELQGRYRFLFGENSTDLLHVLPSELLWMEGNPLNLNEKAQQQRVEDAIAALDGENQRPEVIIFDNLSSLTSGADENDNSALDGLLGWLMKLRHQGFCVILVHHSGKSGAQRGASRREDPLDTVIKLAPPQGSDEDRMGARFIIELRPANGAKIRGLAPRPDHLEVALGRSEHDEAVWTTITAPPESHVLLAEILEHPEWSVRRIAENLEVNKSKVQRWIEDLRKKGLVEKVGHALTPAGLTHARPVEFWTSGQKSLSQCPPPKGVGTWDSGFVPGFVPFGTRA